VLGSLDQPPIVIRSSRLYSALMLLIAAGFVAIGAFMLRDPKESATTSYLIMIFFGAGIPLFAWQVIRPGVLTLSPDGVSWRSPFRTVHYQWSDIQTFRPYKPAAKSLSKHLGFDFTDSYRARRGGPYGLAKAMAGVEGSFGGGWELSAADLAELLNQARARWAEDT
jgi:Bacterial PH domain